MSIPVKKKFIIVKPPSFKEATSSGSNSKIVAPKPIIVKTTPLIVPSEKESVVPKKESEGPDREPSLKVDTEFQFKNLFDIRVTNTSLWIPRYVRVVSIGKNNKTGRYVMLVTDDIITKKIYVVSQLDSKMKTIKKGSVIRMTEYSCSLIDHTTKTAKKIMLILANFET